MVIRTLLILLSGTLLFSCAQVGTLSGGDKDSFAPSPIKIIPEPNQTNFTSNTVELKFNEFVQLNDPTRTIFFVPDDARPKAQLNGKTLRVTWEENLRPNTTYVLYFNGAVKDVNEGNDSLMTYVFSTGNVIDSLEYHTSVENAFSGQLTEGVNVGLYTSDTSQKASYYSRSDRFGGVHFQNLKSDTYFVKAFKDANSNGKIDRSELQGCLEEPLQLDSNRVDSLPIQVSIPDSNYIRTFAYLGGNTFGVGATYPINTSGLKFNNETLHYDEMRVINSDSLHFAKFFDLRASQSLVVDENDWSDTLELRINPTLLKNNKLKLSCNRNTNAFLPKETIEFYSSHVISSLNRSMIQLLSMKDTSFILPDSIDFTKNTITLGFISDLAPGSYTLIIPENTIESQGFITDPVRLAFTVKAKKELGSILVDLTEFGTGVFLELMNNGVVIGQYEPDTSYKTLIENLEPGDYSFRVVEDENGDLRWNGGSVINCIQPEKIYRYYTTVKVRSNWQVDVKLEKQD